MHEFDTIFCFLCPFCRAPAQVVHLRRELNGTHEAVIHATPLCAQFERMNGREYMKAVHYDRN